MFFTRSSALAVAIVLALLAAPVQPRTARPAEISNLDGTTVPGGRESVVSSTEVEGAPVAAPGVAPVASVGAADVESGAVKPAVDAIVLPRVQPNIIVFYLDDLNPAQGLLWGNSVRTPTLHDKFVAHGINFPNAIGETPLCCPGRAGVLTGLHTHNHGVTYNDVTLFNPSEHVARALKEVGYDSYLIGKYMNHPDRLDATAWARHSAGWTQMDVFNSDAFDSSAHYFYNYSLFTKQGTVNYGRYHSTRMIADRAILRMRQSPATKPLFMLLSIYDTHGPNLPMPEFVGDPRCADIAPWKPPNYNEADVSDKPAYIRSRPLLPQTAGWPMRALCEEMLGVDWLVKRVTDELAAQGRLQNTMLVFTADNGMGWGMHRLGQEKQTPYVTPVPLYIHWPSRFGNQPRTVQDIAVNIDLAPTFCELGGCTLGPFSGGQIGPDGVSLLGLLDRTAPNLGRDAVLERNYQKRPFSGLRTTPSNPLGRWHYVEYKDGFRELYDLTHDPWELRNLAYDPSTASVRQALAARLAQLRQEGVGGGGGPSGPQPDGQIAFTSTGTYTGNNIYSSTPLTTQTRKRTGVALGATYDYWVRIQNDGPATTSFNVYGESSGTTAMTTRYLVGGVDVTADVTAGSYTVANLAPRAKVSLVVRIRVGAAVPLGAKRTVLVRIAAAGDATSVDVVRAVAIR
jgi:arylsulfatase A-like enzyme